MTVHYEGILQVPGIMLYPGTGSADGMRGDHIPITPPYNVHAEQIDMILEGALKAVDSVIERVNRGGGTANGSA